MKLAYYVFWHIYVLPFFPGRIIYNMKAKYCVQYEGEIN